MSLILDFFPLETKDKILARVGAEFQKDTMDIEGKKMSII